jgi:pimeloyl-ACP methyl ester carboxylesterase
MRSTIGPLASKLFLVAVFSCVLISSRAQVSADLQDSSAIEKQLYLKYKKELADFERTHGHFIQTPNVRMHYLTWGKRSKTPLIFSHGTNGNAYELYEVADSLVALGYYVVAIDYYGHGLTPVPDKDVSLYHVADDIRFLMDDLKIKKAVISGFSRGGSIATAFYDAYPERVLGLMLEDGGSVAWDVNDHKKPIDTIISKLVANYNKRPPPRIYTSEEELFKRIYKRNGTKPSFKRILFTFLTAAKPTADETWVLNPGLPDLISERSAEQLLVAIYRPFNANSLFGATTHLLYPKVIFRNLHVPLLILDPVSAEDYFDFEFENSLLQKTHPDLVIHRVYTNTGHAVKMENPQAFIKDLHDLLQVINNRKKT